MREPFDSLRSLRAFDMMACHERTWRRAEALAGESNGGEGGNRTHHPARSVGATVLKTVTTTRHVSLSTFNPIVPMEFLKNGE